MKWYLPFAKAEKQDDGTIIVTGIASSETKDAQGEVVKADAMKAAIPDYMSFGGTGALREMHQQIAAGVVLKAEVNDKGETHIEAKVVDANSVKKVEEGVLKGFSIGGKALKKSGSTIEELMLKEISLVDRPANPDARLSIFKADGIEDEGETVEKGLYTTQRLASLLEELQCLEDCESYGLREDGPSPVTPAIKAAIKALSAALKASVDDALSNKADDEIDIAKMESDIGTAVLAKAEALIAPITKGISDLTDALAKAEASHKEEITKLAERLKVVEQNPAAPRAVVSTVSKAQDNGGDVPVMSEAEVAKALAAMPEADRTRLVMKAALANGIQIAG